MGGLRLGLRRGYAVLLQPQHILGCRTSATPAPSAPSSTTELRCECSSCLVLKGLSPWLFFEQGSDSDNHAANMGIEDLNSVWKHNRQDEDWRLGMF